MEQRQAVPVVGSGWECVSSEERDWSLSDAVHKIKGIDLLQIRTTITGSFKGRG